MKATVVIPTHNRKKILSHTLQYYAFQVHNRESFELVVVDDGSDDDTSALFEQLMPVKHDCSRGLLRNYSGRIETIRRGWYEPKSQKQLFLRSESPNVRYVKIEKSGRSVARNIGILFSVYPLIIFADDDIFVEPEFVKKHIEAHTMNDRCVVTGKVIHTKDLENPFSAHWKLKDINTAFLSTGNASVMKRYLFQAGLFDENYTVYGWEDFDLGIHLKEIGLKSIRRGIYGYHYEHQERFFDPKKVYLKEKERGISAVYFYKNHPLKWVRRFTMVENRLFRSLFRFLGMKNWFFAKKRLSLFKGLFLLIVRYKGYFDGIMEAKRGA